jgi:DNA-binding beta-propeller fold protein YncE
MTKIQEPSMTLSAPAPARTSEAIELLFKEARRRRRRRRLLVCVVVTLAAGSLWAGLAVTNPAQHPSRTAIAGSTPPRVAPKSDLSATTAYVADVQGLVPVNLATGAVGAAIRIPGFTGVDGTTNVVGSPSGHWAYVVSEPATAPLGRDEPGPSLVPVNLLTRQLGAPIPFRASAIRLVAFGAPTFDLTGVAITPDGRTVLVADAADRSIIPIDLRTRRAGRPITIPAEPTFSGLSGSFDAGSVVARLQPAAFGAIVVNPDDTTAYVADGYVVVPVSLTEHRAVRAITGFDEPSMIAVSPNGRLAYVTNPDCWESLKTDECVATPKHPVHEPNGRIQFGAVGQFVDVVNLRSDKIVHRTDVGKFSQPTGVAVSPDGKTVYVTFGQYGDRGNQIAVIDAATGAVEAWIGDGIALSRNEGTGDIALTPDGTEAFLSAFEVVTPGPFGAKTYRGVVVVDLTTETAEPGISFGQPVKPGMSTGPVIFGG